VHHPTAVMSLPLRLEGGPKPLIEAIRSSRGIAPSPNRRSEPAELDRGDRYCGNVAGAEGGLGGTDYVFIQ